MNATAVPGAISAVPGAGRTRIRRPRAYPSKARLPTAIAHTLAAAAIRDGRQAARLHLPRLITTRSIFTTDGNERQVTLCKERSGYWHMGPRCAHPPAGEYPARPGAARAGAARAGSARARSARARSAPEGHVVAGRIAGPGRGRVRCGCAIEAQPRAAQPASRHHRPDQGLADKDQRRPGRPRDASPAARHDPGQRGQVTLDHRAGCPAGQDAVRPGPPRSPVRRLPRRRHQRGRNVAGRRRRPRAAPVAPMSQNTR